MIVAEWEDSLLGHSVCCASSSLWESTRGPIDSSENRWLTRKLARTFITFITRRFTRRSPGHVSGYTSGRMGSNQSKNRALPNTIAPLGTERTRELLDLRFRVLVIGRANAGKTSILQRVCDTTESPKIYKGGRKARGPNFCPRV